MTTQPDQDEYAAADRTNWHRTRLVLLYAVVTFVAAYMLTAIAGRVL